MSAVLDPRVREFERQLDEALAARPMVRFGGADALRLAANMVEVVAAERGELATHLAEGLQILAPALIGAGPGDEIGAADVLADLQFATHYFHLRDLLYYTYNAPGSIAWTFGEGSVEIRYLDASLPRQFFISTNNWFLDSMAAFTNEEQSERIHGLLRGSPEFELTPEAIEAQDVIQAEVDLKFELYFNLVSDVSVAAGAYTFADFLKVYEALLVKALYHRYHATINGARGMVRMPLAELASDIEASVEDVSAEVAAKVVADISYGEDARRARLDPVYFSLYHVPDGDEIIMLPHHFAMWEGFVCFLRLVALRDPQLFLRSFSQQVGSALVRRLAQSVEDAGFRVHTNVPLREYDTQLPDIDLLIISEERTLGYAILACEVKSPIPPRWAKDQLRVLEADSIAKAFEQLQRINSFFDTDDGVRFLREQIPEEGLPDFSEFALLVWTMVATSDNAGALLADRGTIIDFRTFERLLSRCGADMLYVIDTLKRFPQWADDSFDRVMVDAQVGVLAVSYEGVRIAKLMDFPINTFRSAGAPEELVRGMLDNDHLPLDVFRERGVDFGDGVLPPKERSSGPPYGPQG
ncbi:MAG: hypothetical protein VX424_12715 [Actinomycetota bacterium]|nr:hypothetical protein [Actinomycetota bacterium]